MGGGSRKAEGPLARTSGHQKSGGVCGGKFVLKVLALRLPSQSDQHIVGHPRARPGESRLPPPSGVEKYAGPRRQQGWLRYSESSPRHGDPWHLRAQGGGHLARRVSHRAEAVAQTPGGLNGAVVRVGSEMRRASGRPRRAQRHPASPTASQGRLRERRPAFREDVCATASARWDSARSACDSRLA